MVGLQAAPGLTRQDYIFHSTMRTATFSFALYVLYFVQLDEGYAKPNELPPATPPLVAVHGVDVTVPVALKARIDTAYNGWSKDFGAEFQGSLTFFEGSPILMLFTTPEEPADKTLRRRRAIVLAFEYLLDEGAFSSATVCVVTGESKGQGKKNVMNYEIRRSDYQVASRKTGKASSGKAIGIKKREDDAKVRNLSAALGIK